MVDVECDEYNLEIRPYGFGQEIIAKCDTRKIADLRFKPSQEDNKAIIDTVKVHKGYRNKGVGTSLYRYLCSYLKDEMPDIEYVSGEVMTDAAWNLRRKVFPNTVQAPIEDELWSVLEYEREGREVGQWADSLVDGCLESEHYG